MVTPAAKREAVARLKSVHEMSERRACRVIGCQRMTVRYHQRWPDDPRLRDRLVALARERPRSRQRVAPAPEDRPARFSASSKCDANDFFNA